MIFKSSFLNSVVVFKAVFCIQIVSVNTLLSMYPLTNGTVNLI